MKRLPVAVWVYLLIVATAIGYLVAIAHETAFCGLPAVTLTLPWSVLLTLAGASVAPRMFDSSLIPGIVIIVMSAGINSWIICRIVRRKNNKKEGA